MESGGSKKSSKRDSTLTVHKRYAQEACVSADVSASSVDVDERST